MWDVKYRPLKFSDVLGQEGNVKLLKSRLRNGTAFDTSYVFAGGYGRGKTTLSRIHARAMLCLDLDKNDPEPCNRCENCRLILDEQPGAFSERDAASQGTIDHMRAIVEELPFVIPNAPKRIYLFDEAHRMSNSAQDVLLKPLEEKVMVGMFCTTEPSKLRGAIRSRSEEYTIRPVTRETILERMKKVLTTEAVQFEDDAVFIVIDQAGGHVRDVLNMLETVSQLGPITTASVREYLRLSSVALYYEILLSLDDTKKAIGLLDQACDNTSPDDIAAGIAEAAMNSYRIANGMLADFSTADRKLAEQVYAKYQANVVKFSEWFLRSRFTTRLSLTRDIVVLSQAPGHLPVEGNAPPVVFAGAVVQQVSAQVPIVPSPAPLPRQSVAPSPTPEYTAYADPTPAATPLEAHAMNAALPRRRGQTDVVSARKADRSHRTMTPIEWKTGFEQLWRRKMQ